MPSKTAPEAYMRPCEQLAGPEADALLAQLRAASDVPVRPHVDGPRIIAAARRALARVGYAFQLTAQP
jgi:hypothetical protein